MLVALTRTDQGVITRVFPILPVLTKGCVGPDSDLTLLWLLIVAFSMFASSFSSLPQESVLKHIQRINGCFSDVFTRFIVQYNHVSQWESMDDLARSIAVSFTGLGFAKLTLWIEKWSLLEIRRATSIGLISFVAILFIHIFGNVKRVSLPLASRLAKEISLLSIIGKDECCRMITKTIGTHWDTQDLKILDIEGIRNLQSAGIRSLIKIEKATQSENLLCLSKVLTVAPPDVISEEKIRLLDTISRCLTFQTVENMLDAIAAIFLSGCKVEEINNMSAISLPRILLLSVSENASTRSKANSILRFFSQAQDDGGIIGGLVNVLGRHEVGVLANFFLDWTAKGNLNLFAMGLLSKLFDAISPDEKIVSDFTRKVVPMLSKILTPGDGAVLQERLQITAFEMLTRLLCYRTATFERGEDSISALSS
jgi:hypothetical protein